MIIIRAHGASDSWNVLRTRRGDVCREWKHERAVSCLERDQLLGVDGNLIRNLGALGLSHSTVPKAGCTRTTTGAPGRRHDR